VELDQQLAGVKEKSKYSTFIYQTQFLYKLSLKADISAYKDHPELEISFGHF
jgi:heme oxygenase